MNAVSKTSPKAHQKRCIPSQRKYHTTMLPNICIKTKDKTSQKERDRGLRGLVRHLTSMPAPDANQRQAVGSYLAPYYGGALKPPWGRCQWCWGEVERGPTGRPRSWHKSCHEYRAAAQGSPSGADAPLGELTKIDGPYGPTRRHRCIACGNVSMDWMELDHILAIGVARRLGLSFYRRAMTPDNVWWICRSCHVVKTAFDRALMRSLDNPITAEQEMHPDYSDAPLFNYPQDPKGHKDGNERKPLT